MGGEETFFAADDDFELELDLADEEPSRSPFAAALGGRLSTTFWSTSDPAGSLNTESGNYFDPRATFLLDASAYDRFFLHATARVDQGFDPLDSDGFELRLDEVFLRYSPSDNNLLQLQAGRFATVFGGWVSQHDGFDSPFISPPLPYGQIIGLNIRNPAGNSAAAIAGRANGTLTNIFDSPKSLWASAIWGPSYGTGFSLTGQTTHWDYAVEVKNIPLTEQARDWDNGFDRLEYPTWTGRLGYRPSASVSMGFSASHGPYLTPDAESLLPNGTDIGDLPYTTLGADFRWSGGSLIFTTEVIASQYETLEDLELQNLSYYTELRWKATPSIFLATRWGQSFHNEIPAPDGELIRWSPNVWRIGASAGWRVTPDVLIKCEFSHTSIDQDGVDEQNLFGLDASWRF